jgi:hypothetical protein
MPSRLDTTSSAPHIGTQDAIGDARAQQRVDGSDDARPRLTMLDGPDSTVARRDPAITRADAKAP